MLSSGLTLPELFFSLVDAVSAVVVDAAAAELLVEDAVEADSEVGEVDEAVAVVVFDAPLLSAPLAFGALSHPAAIPNTSNPNVTSLVAVMIRPSQRIPAFSSVTLLAV
jgi:hypothetical protein